MTGSFNIDSDMKECVAVTDADTLRRGKAGEIKKDGKDVTRNGTRWRSVEKDKLLVTFLACPTMPHITYIVKSYAIILLHMCHVFCSLLGHLHFLCIFS